VCLPLLVFPCTIKSRSSLLAPAHPGGPGKGLLNSCGGGVCDLLFLGDNMSPYHSFAVCRVHMETMAMHDIMK